MVYDIRTTAGNFACYGNCRCDMTKSELRTAVISAIADIEGLAQMLLRLAQGLGILVRTPPREELETLVDQVSIYT